MCFQSVYGIMRRLGRKYFRLPYNRKKSKLFFELQTPKLPIEHRLADSEQFGLAIATMVFNEASYLKEWIDFHIYQGVERIFLYDHQSTDNTFDVLQPYIRNGTVQYIFWPNFFGSAAQIFALSHSLHLAQEYRWLMQIDLDEFMFSVDGYPLPQVLKQYENNHGLKVSWRNFGTSGHKIRPHGFVTLNYTKSFTDLTYPNLRNEHYAFFKFKSIVNPRSVLVNDVHEPLTPTPLIDISHQVYCNHYVTKSEAEFEIKLSKLSGFVPRPKVHAAKRRKLKEFLDENSVEDQYILKAVPRYFLSTERA